MKVVATEKLMRPIADFSHAAVTDDLILIGAMAGIDAELRLAGSTPGTTDFEAQTQKIFENLETVLDVFGACAENLLRLKIYLSDMRNVEAYRRLFEVRFGVAKFDHIVVASSSYPLPQAVIELDAFASRPEVAPPFRFHSVSIDQHTQQSADLADAIAATLRNATINLDQICFFNVTMVEPFILPQIAKALAHVFATVPPYTVTSSQLGSRAAGILVELILYDGEIVLGPNNPERSCSAFARTGDYLFLPGHPGEPERGTVLAQTHGIWEKINDTLAEAEFPAGSIIRTNNILSDWRDYTEFNKAYGHHVEWPFPPRTTMQAAIAEGAKAQIEALAFYRPLDVTVLQVPKKEASA